MVRLKIEPSDYHVLLLVIDIAQNLKVRYAVYFPINLVKSVRSGNFKQSSI